MTKLYLSLLIFGLNLLCFTPTSYGSDRSEDKEFQKNVKKLQQFQQKNVSKMDEEKQKELKQNQKRFKEAVKQFNKSKWENIFFFVGELQELPEQISDLGKKVRSLNLSSNKLQKLPDLKTLENLVELTVTDSYLSQLPVLNTALTSLNLSHNQFSSIPLEIQNLSQLTKLDLSHNPIPVEHIDKFKQEHQSIDVIFN